MFDHKHKQAYQLWKPIVAGSYCELRNMMICLEAQEEGSGDQRLRDFLGALGPSTTIAHAGSYLKFTEWVKQKPQERDQDTLSKAAVLIRYLRQPKFGDGKKPGARMVPRNAMAHLNWVRERLGLHSRWPTKNKAVQAVLAAEHIKVMATGSQTHRS